MVQILLTKYWVLAHLLVTAGTLYFIPAPTAMMGVWCVASLLMMLFCLPPVLKGESFWLARGRVVQAMRSEVLVYASLLAVLYVGIQLLNGPRELVYAVELKRWMFADPACPGLPSSVNPAAGVPFFVGLLGGLGCAVVIRTALPRKQRLYLLLGLGSLTGLLALGARVVTCFMAEVPTLSWLGGAFEAGILWLLLMSVALGIALESLVEHRIKTLAVALGVAFFNLLGCLCFGSQLAILMTTIVSIIYLLFAVFVVRGSGMFPKVVWYVTMLLPVLFGLALGFVFRPELDLMVFFDTDLWSTQAAEFGKQWGFRSGLALDVLSKSPMLGVGPDGLTHFAPFFLDGKFDWALWNRGGTVWSCDALRLLASCGLMGTVLLLIPGFALIGRCLMRWVEYRQNIRASRRIHYSMRYLFVLIGSVVGVVCTFIASWFGTPLHTPAVLVSFLIICACMGGWMPRKH